MATIFAVGTFEQTALAASEIFSRIRDKTIDDDKALLGNQACGIAAFGVELVLGKPGDVVVPIGAVKAAEMTTEEAESYLAFVATQGMPKSGDKSQYIAALVALAKLVQPYLPPTAQAAVAVLLSLLG